MYLRSATDFNNGLQFNSEMDGPSLWGNVGGGLGTVNNKNSIKWNANGDLTVAGNIKAGDVKVGGKLISKDIDDLYNKMGSKADQSIANTVYSQIRASIPGPDARFTSINPINNDDWLHVKGSTKNGTAMYNGVSIKDGGGLSVGEWKKVPQGNVEVTGDVKVGGKLISKDIDDLYNKMGSKADQSIANTVYSQIRASIPGPDARFTSINPINNDDWLHVKGSTKNGTAMYNGVSIKDGGGLSVGEWKKVPQGNVEVTGDVIVAGKSILNMGSLTESADGARKAQIKWMGKPESDLCVTQENDKFKLTKCDPINPLQRFKYMSGKLQTYASNNETDHCINYRVSDDKLVRSKCADTQPFVDNTFTNGIPQFRFRHKNTAGENMCLHAANAIASGGVNAEIIQWVCENESGKNDKFIWN